MTAPSPTLFSKELLQRLHVGELKPSLNERLLQSRKEAEAKGKWSFESVINMPQIYSDTSDVPLEDQLVSVLVEDMLEHSLPYIHAVPLFAAVKAYGITFKRVSLLCSIYLENAIYRGKEPSAQSLIPDSEKRYIVGKLKAVLDEIPTLTTLSEQKESTLRGEINRGYYKILSAFISKKDLRDFMALAGERQIVEAEGLPFNYCEGINLPAPTEDNDSGGKSTTKRKSTLGVLQEILTEQTTAIDIQAILVLIKILQGKSRKEILGDPEITAKSKDTYYNRIKRGIEILAQNGIEWG